LRINIFHENFSAGSPAIINLSTKIEALTAWAIAYAKVPVLEKAQAYNGVKR
jgi:hypothetical protein